MKNDQNSFHPPLPDRGPSFIFEDDSSSGKGWRSRRNIISFLLIGILMLAIPFGVRLVEQRQQVRSKATLSNEDAIKFSGSGANCTTSAGGDQPSCAATANTLDIDLTSPFGPPGQISQPPPAPSQAVSPTPTPTAPASQ